MEIATFLEFYKDKTVLITGHTGFKGTWLCQILIGLGAKVVGYSLTPPTVPSIFELSGIEKQIHSHIGDIRDFDTLKSIFDKYQPEIVFHLAAQPIVLESYKNPRYTYETNVMGTVNVLECIRLFSSVKSFVNITTDKVYENNEDFTHAFKEDEKLDGYDPYSNSKSCSELVTHAYQKSFFKDVVCAISTARAGNVIGGGDFAKNRIIPDCVRSVEKNVDIVVRNPNSVRPYQHVLEPLFCYLLIAKEQYFNRGLSGYYNVGPNDSDCVSTAQLVTLFCSEFGTDARWTSQTMDGPHEANFLKLDCTKVKTVFGWKPIWSVSTAIHQVVEWTKAYFDNPQRIQEIMKKQIMDYEKDMQK